MTAFKAQLFEAMRGQQATVEDLRQVGPRWPEGTHPQVDEVRKEVNDWFETFWNGDEKKTRRFQAADVGRLAGMCWPRAGYEGLRFAAMFMAWIFLWDDHFDNVKDVGVAREYCEETKRYITCCLGRDEADVENDVHDDEIFTAFRGVVSVPLRQKHNLRRRRVMLEQLLGYVDSVIQETEVLLSEELPSIQGYWGYRTQCSAGGPMLLLD
ncbi:uncharacterized protein CTRU02_212068 [Colletotrichum truncatum]|uniref:Uncharacterized protein n=1 Tax=Colletotrichum truncatum TaxID=5467 RepID=A0ACC3YMG7_COLTU